MHIDTLWLKHASPDNDAVTEISGQSYDQSASSGHPDQVCVGVCARTYVRACFCVRACTSF